MVRRSVHRVTCAAMSSCIPASDRTRVTSAAGDSASSSTLSLTDESTSNICPITLNEMNRFVMWLYIFFQTWMQSCFFQSISLIYRFLNFNIPCAFVNEIKKRCCLIYQYIVLDISRGNTNNVLPFSFCTCPHDGQYRPTDSFKTISALYLQTI